MNITAAQVKELRDKTGIAMMDCKKALIETDGDMEKAIENLRKKGQATAEKRAGKEVKQGTVAIIRTSRILGKPLAGRYPQG